VLLHCCCTVIALLLHCCYTIVTLLLHYRHTAITLLLHTAASKRESGDQQMLKVSVASSYLSVRVPRVRTRGREAKSKAKARARACATGEIIHVFCVLACSYVSTRIRR
jgi:hypothetical protein